MNTFIILNGNSSSLDKLNAVKSITSNKGRKEWMTLLAKNSRLIRTSDICVILNNSRASIPFRFQVPTGMYSISMRCIAPSISSNTGTYKLDNGSVKEFNSRQQTFTLIK